MKRLFVVFMVVVSVVISSSCSLSTVKRNPRSIIEKAMVDSQNFIRIYYIAKTVEYHIYLTQTPEGYVQLIYISATYPVEVLKTVTLLDCSGSGWN